VAGAFAGILYQFVNLVITPPLDSFNTFTDEFAKETEFDESDVSTPPIADIPLTAINELLYLNNKNATTRSTSTSLAKVTPTPSNSPPNSPHMRATSNTSVGVNTVIDPQANQLTKVELKRINTYPLFVQDENVNIPRTSNIL